MSRPRRFGKSLLLSTLAAYFEGRRDLFEGLAIEEKTGEWPKYPVLYLDLSNQTCAFPSALEMVLNDQLTIWEELYGRRESERSPSLRFGGVIRRAHAKFEQRVVVLVDEYDKPLLDTLDDEWQREKNRVLLHDVYSNLKKYDGCIGFAMLTGVTRFSKLSVFSGLNNLNDISMDSEYATICGITEGELQTYFAAGLAQLAQKYKLSVDEIQSRLKRRYDGYRFEEDAERVYNPFSLLNVLAKKKFGDYWFATGTPTFLAEMLAREQYDLNNLTNRSIAGIRFNTLDTLRTNPLPILYQSGYLTLDHCDEDGDY